MKKETCVDKLINSDVAYYELDLYFAAKIDTALGLSNFDEDIAKERDRDGGVTDIIVNVLGIEINVDNFIEHIDVVRRNRAVELYDYSFENGKDILHGLPDAKINGDGSGYWEYNHIKYEFPNKEVFIEQYIKFMYIDITNPTHPDNYLEIIKDFFSTFEQEREIRDYIGETLISRDGHNLKVLDYGVYTLEDTNSGVTHLLSDQYFDEGSPLFHLNLYAFKVFGSFLTRKDVLDLSIGNTIEYVKEYEL